jgi:hypothetical protein
MNEIKPYSKAIVYLLRKTAEKSSPVWNDILLYQSEIQEYLSVIGLELIVKKDEGFAFVKQVVYDDDATMNLVTRRQLGFEVSIVVIVLRQLKFPTPVFMMFHSSNWCWNTSVYQRFRFVKNMLISVLLLILPCSGLVAC